MQSLETALPLMRDRLSDGGVLAVISYHSGEDRAVKHAMREWSLDCICPPRQITCTCRGRALGSLITRKPVTATESEICLLYTSDAADERSSVDLGGRRIIKKK